MDITPEIWERVKSLFEAALEQDADQRVAFLAQNCPDRNIREQVEELLSNHDRAVEPAVGRLASSAVPSCQPALNPGALLVGRFKVIRFIAEGGMGEVYEAEDLELHQHLAIKTLRREVLQQTNALARFKREVYLARKVTHPNVCRIFDLFRDKPEGSEEIVFVSMEFLRGETVAERIKREGRMSMAEALPLIIQMASALGAAHEAGIVHGDFKPGNVMLVNGAAGMRAVVTDFGLALRALNPTTDPSLSTTSWLLDELGEGRHLYGTPAYMAPEQIEGQPASTASDVYSLGLVIYEMVAGVRPFRAETPISTAVKRLTEAPPSPRKFEPNVSLVCESVILRCLDREPAKRFAKANDVAKGLNDYVRGADSGGVLAATSVTVSKSSSYPSSRLEVAHVLFMDIVAYSLLHMDLQQQLLNELQEAVRNSPAFARAHADDHLIRLPTGDGMALVFFGDPEAPVRCALELARILHDRADINLRMGIHSGPVYRIADINANQNVAGGGINIAQRVMDCGDAGHILVSRAAAEFLGQVSAWSRMLHDLGEVEVKHGVRIHLYSLYDDEAGNPALPKKISMPKATPFPAVPDVTTKNNSLLMIAGAAVLALASVGSWLFYARTAHALRETDTIVLTDFTNKTGDAIFDDTLQQGLATELQQSPFLNILSDKKVRATLQLMGHSPSDRLDEGTARELCRRTGSKATLAGSITSMGSHYVLGLNAANCVTGDSLAREEAEATRKEEVLNILDQAATKLRAKLGESLASIQEFETPVEQATTPSLEALQAYSLGRKELISNMDAVAAAPLFQRAIELDPNFAMAHLSLGLSYLSMGENGSAEGSIRKAYQLRERVSQWERFAIESRYYYAVIGDLQKARQTYELWGQAYPRDPIPVSVLSTIDTQLGQYEKALAEVREQFRLGPGSLQPYVGLVDAYLNLNRLEEARTTAKEMEGKNFDSPDLRFSLYQLAFFQDDTAGMAQQVAWAVGKPGVEDVLLANEADTAAYFGQLRKARELSRQAVVSAERAEQKETAASYEIEGALREALFGDPAEARDRAALALEPSTDRSVRYGAALALAITRNAGRVEVLADDLNKRFPQDTLVQFNYLPTIEAQRMLNSNDPPKAIEALQVAAPYELGTVGDMTLYPVYVRGEAYLAAQQGNDAAAEFQKILDHRGIVLNEPIGALAHLGLARAYALQGDTAKAKTAYQDFFALWKDADPDIPILKEAKAEYAKLQ